MEILAISSRIQSYLESHQLERAFRKQIELFVANPLHPSLHTELLEPKQMKLYSFRISRSFRAIFIYRAGGIVEIIDANNHYR